jgi:hypothetical protein
VTYCAADVDSSSAGGGGGARAAAANNVLAGLDPQKYAQQVLCL